MPARKPKKVRSLQFYQIHIDEHGEFKQEDPIRLKSGDFIQIIFAGGFDITVDIEPLKKIVGLGGSSTIHS